MGRTPGCTLYAPPHTHTSSHRAHPDSNQHTRISHSLRHTCAHRLRCTVPSCPQNPDTGVSAPTCRPAHAPTCLGTLHRHMSTHPQKHTGAHSLGTVPQHTHTHTHTVFTIHTQTNMPTGTGVPEKTHRPTHTCPKLAPKAGTAPAPDTHGHACTPAQLSQGSSRRRPAPPAVHTHLTHTPPGQQLGWSSFPSPPPSPSPARGPVYDPEHRAEPRGREIGCERQGMRLQILSTGK